MADDNHDSVRQRRTRVTIVDGNALAGPLEGVFAVDPTLLQLTCGHCEATDSLAVAVVELDDFAAIVRCRACGHTLLTVLFDEDRATLRLAALAEITAPHDAYARPDAS